MSDEPVLVGAPTQTACRAAVVMAASVLPAGTSLRLMAQNQDLQNASDMTDLPLSMRKLAGLQGV